MRESWRHPHERIVRAPETGDGSGSRQPEVEKRADETPEASTIRIPMKEWLAQVKAGFIPEGAPEKAQGTRQKKEFNAFIEQYAAAQGFGMEVVDDKDSLEKALVTYAKSRVSGSIPRLAALSAKFKLSELDRARFDEVVEDRLERKLLELHVVHPGPLDLKSQAGAASQEGRMTEEELLRGLEGLVPPEKPTVEAPKDDPDAVPESFERAYKVFQELRRTGTPQEDQIPLASRGLIGNAEYPRFKAYIQEKIAVAEREKNAAKNERRSARRAGAAAEQPSESSEAKQARINAAARIFFDRVEKGADATFMYQIAENSLPERDIIDFKDLLEKNGAHINGTSGKDMPPFVEAAATHKEAKEMLGRPDGSVGDVPYWNLPGKSAAVFDRPSPGFQKYVLTIQDGGVHRFPGGWHEYRDGAFHAIDEETVLARRASAASTRREAAAAQPAERTRPADSPIERTAAGESGAEASPVDAARKMFLRKYHKERMKAGKAFNESTKRLDVDEKLELVEELRETTDIPDGILDGIASNLRHDAKKGGTEGRRAGRLDREIEEDIAAIGGKRSAESAPRETRRGRESAQERLNREIEEDIAKVLAKK